MASAELLINRLRTRQWAKKSTINRAECSQDFILFSLLIRAIRHHKRRAYFPARLDQRLGNPFRRPAVESVISQSREIMQRVPAPERGFIKSATYIYYATLRD